jgi:hypothetical protein
VCGTPSGILQENHPAVGAGSRPSEPMALHPLDDAPFRVTTCTSTIRRNNMSAGREREGCQNSPIIGPARRRVKQNPAKVLANPKIWSQSVTSLRFLDGATRKIAQSRGRWNKFYLASGLLLTWYRVAYLGAVRGSSSLHQPLARKKLIPWTDSQSWWLDSLPWESFSGRPVTGHLKNRPLLPHGSGCFPYRWAPGRSLNGSAPG